MGNTHFMFNYQYHRFVYGWANGWFMLSYNHQSWTHLNYCFKWVSRNFFFCLDQWLNGIERHVYNSILKRLMNNTWQRVLVHYFNLFQWRVFILILYLTLTPRLLWRVGTKKALGFVLRNYLYCIQALSDIFESLAGAIFLDSNGDLQTVWSVFYRIMRQEIYTFSRRTPLQPVKVLYEKIHACPIFG